MICPNCGKEIEDGKKCTCSDDVTNEMLVKQYREMVYDHEIKKERNNNGYRRDVLLLILTVVLIAAVIMLIYTRFPA